LKNLPRIAIGWLLVVRPAAFLHSRAREHSRAAAPTAPAVTLTDNGSTVTIANGIVSIVCTKSSGQISNINYTFNNNGSSQTLNLVSGNPNGGKFYWEDSNNEGLTFTYYARVRPGQQRRQLRGNCHGHHDRGQHRDGESTIRCCAARRDFTPLPSGPTRSTGTSAFSIGRMRDNIYAGSIFNWMSVDAARSRLMEVSPAARLIGVLGAPVEVFAVDQRNLFGQYEDKYKYSADFGN
jgi:hypothetical protein